MKQRYTDFLCNNVVDNENKLEIINAIDKLNEQDLEIKELNNQLSNLDWYKMWHKNFQQKIEKMQKELETFRPTKLTGNGQCSCHQCEIDKGFNRHWSSWCYRFKGYTYCGDCMNKLFPEFIKIAVEEKK